MSAFGPDVPPHRGRFSASVERLIEPQDSIPVLTNAPLSQLIAVDSDARIARDIDQDGTLHKEFVVGVLEENERAVVGHCDVPAISHPSLTSFSMVKGCWAPSSQGVPSRSIKAIRNQRVKRLISVPRQSAESIAPRTFPNIRSSSAAPLPGPMCYPFNPIARKK
jgi:hypothetical protein